MALGLPTRPAQEELGGDGDRRGGRWGRPAELCEVPDSVLTHSSAAMPLPSADILERDMHCLLLDGAGLRLRSYSAGIMGVQQVSRTGFSCQYISICIDLRNAVTYSTFS